MPRLIDHDSRKAQIAQALWRVVVAHGIRAVSLRTVAAEAELAVGSVRHVLPTRTDLLVFAAESMIETVGRRATAVERTGSTIDVALRALSETLPLDDTRRAELDVNIAIIAESRTTPELVPVRDAAYRSLRAGCARIVTLLAPEMSAERTAVCAARLHALVDGLALHLLTEHDASAISSSETAEVPTAQLVPLTGTRCALEILRTELESLAEHTHQTATQGTR